MWDTYTAMWHHYVVLGAKLKVTIMNTSSNIGAACGSLMWDDAANVAYGSKYSYIENARVSRYFSEADGQGKQVMYLYYSPKKFWGIASTDDDRLVHNTASDGTAYPAYFNIHTFLSGSTTGTIKLFCELEYLVLFKTRKKGVAS